MSRPACGACGSPASRPLFVVRGHRYLRCAVCGSGRLAAPLAEPSALYDTGYFDLGEHGGYAGYDEDAAVHARTARRRLDRVAPWTPPGPARLVDVGCASGYVLLEARRRGWEAAGVEISSTATARARGRGLCVEATFALASDDLDGRPTAVTFFQVLEHLPDPTDALAEVVRRAAPGAVVAIETWDAGSWTARAFGRRWQQVNPPTVVHLFTRVGLRSMAARTGLRVMELKVTPKPVSLRLVANVATGAWPTAGRALHRAVAALRLDDRAVPYVLDDLVTMTCLTPGR